jgi:phosphate transport system substrate-binding protein
MRYIACEGQVNMAAIGYSPLPPNLSQEVVNSIARLQGTAPETLSAGNCANPRFHGSLGAGAASPKDPLAGRILSGGGAAGRAAAGAGNARGNAAGAKGNTTAGAAGPAASTDAASGALAAGRAGDVPAVGGGSGVFQVAAPVVYNRPGMGSSSPVPVLLLFLLLGVPPVLLSRSERFSGQAIRAAAARLRSR